MNFLEQLKDNLNDPRNRRGMSRQCIVDSRALRELIHHFESIDSIERLKYNESSAPTLGHKLALTIEALYRNNGKSADRVLQIVMDVLRPLIKEKDLENHTHRIFDNHKG